MARPGMFGKVFFLKTLMRQLEGIKADTANKSKSDWQVGYSAQYAIYVHEDLSVAHRIGKAKFLEDPAKQLVPEMNAVIATHMQQGKGLSSGLYAAARLLFVESQKQVPVSEKGSNGNPPGYLRDSAFIRKKTHTKGGSRSGGLTSRDDPPAPPVGF